MKSSKLYDINALFLNRVPEKSTNLDSFRIYALEPGGLNKSMSLFNLSHAMGRA